MSGDHEAIAEELTGVLEAVRELHKPEEMENIVRLVRGIATLVIECHGCEPNFSDWGMDYQGWPCSTARIVYTQAEIEKALEGA